VAKPVIENLQDGSKNDDNLEIYPDPELFHRQLLNKSRLSERHDESIIKICKF
jgi:hypothetical protein